MSFEIHLVSNRPFTDVEELDSVAAEFLRQIGYLSRAGDSVEEARESVGYRMFVDCFLRRRDKPWTAEELEAYLDTSKPTVYRHIAKLKNLDLLEATSIIDDEGNAKKGYMLRYSDLSKAWGIVEAHVELTMQNYRKNVDHLQKLVDK